MDPHVAVVAGLEPAACALTVRHARPVRLTTIDWYPTAVSRRAVLLCRSCRRLAGRAKIGADEGNRTLPCFVGNDAGHLGRIRILRLDYVPHGDSPTLSWGRYRNACLEPLASTCTGHRRITSAAHRYLCFSGMLAEGCAHDAHSREGTSRLAGGPAPRAVSLPSSGTQTWSRTRTERLSAACSAT